MATKAVKIVEWKVIGDNTNFTVLGMDDKGSIYYWKDSKWNTL
jgi:hypothetical protein